MGAALGVLSFIFKDWRIIALLIAGALIAGAVWKYKSLQGDLEEARQVLKIEQGNNQVLRNNLDSAGKINAENAGLLEQAQKDKQAALDAVNGLNKSLQQTNKSVADIKKRIEAIQAPPEKLTPYLVEAIKGAQELRDAEQAPVPIKPIEPK